MGDEWESAFDRWPPEGGQPIGRAPENGPAPAPGAAPEGGSAAGSLSDEVDRAFDRAMDRVMLSSNILYIVFLLSVMGSDVRRNGCCQRRQVAERREGEPPAAAARAAPGDTNPAGVGGLLRVILNGMNINTGEGSVSSQAICCLRCV